MKNNKGFMKTKEDRHKNKIKNCKIQIQTKKLTQTKIFYKTSKIKNQKKIDSRLLKNYLLSHVKNKNQKAKNKNQNKIK